jgi:hypothetical protein
MTDQNGPILGPLVFLLGLSMVLGPRHVANYWLKPWQKLGHNPTPKPGIILSVIMGIAAMFWGIGVFLAAISKAG